MRASVISGERGEQAGERNGPLRIALLGCGVVGSQVARLLAEQGADLAARAGGPLEIAGIAVRRPELARTSGIDASLLTGDALALVRRPGVDIVVELIGGIEPARSLVLAALGAGRSVVTANKALLASDGAALHKAAGANGADLYYEAAVAGAIPLLRALRESLAGDTVNRVLGIVNGTTNFVLDRMDSDGADFGPALAEAQRLGYAETDPSADIDGLDARSKLAILAALAFGEKITPADIFVEGIRRISPMDFQYAHQLGHTIRLICGARQTPDGLILSVRPALVGLQTIIAGVQGAYNAVWVKGRYGEDTFYYGRGAGSLPTGVAVVSDLMRVAREIRHGRPERVSPFAHERLGEYKPLSVTSEKCAYYLRFRVDDRPGIIASLAGILAEQHISLEAVLQLPSDSKHDLPFVITVEPTFEHAVREAVQKMSNLEFLREPPLALPMEPPL